MFRRTARFALPVVAALALSACGIGGGSDTADTTATVSGEVKGEITFQTWNLKGGYEKYFTDLVTAFQTANPGTTVKWIDQPPEGYQDKLSADAAAGSLPDVVDIGPEAAFTLANAGMLLDLSKTDPDAAKDYLPKAWEANKFASLGGGIYAYPWYLNTGPSFYNTALLDKCGVPKDNLPATYDALFAAGEAMAAKCKSGETMVGRLPAIETFGAYGVPLMNAEGTKFTFNDAKGAELVNHYKKLFEAGGLTEATLNKLQTGEVDAFKAGQVGWLPGSSYTLKDLKATAPKIAETVAIAPHVTNDKPNMYIESLAVNAKSKNTATAVAFAKFATNKANQLGFSNQAAIFPSATGALDDAYFTTDDGTPETKLRVESAKAVSEAIVYWPAAFSSKSVDFLREQIALAVLGKKDVQAALDESVKYADENLPK
ncbi:ABC transporter substrate-binding protein [Actinoplanes couchii]|uniref:Sugar ABC transporter substrate-binding protein n=1 Tax=Actinoplanes couchii TaxID=403638 RepID=A0ABQ3XE57_9ACTN|nr:extracellular solute-binding protein [Actinoplanes couchii]MDR6317267.1 multiple sugar transport system substrate-binding protein [Actinoplanes couchii]GID56761.1 sugar ABC transporter substrate-binding protein [Actinoplanes couchii]